MPASDIVKTNSKVFALDTSEEMLVEVEKRVVRAEIKNVVGILTSEYDLKLPDQTVSLESLNHQGNLRLLSGKKSRHKWDHPLIIELAKMIPFKYLKLVVLAFQNN